MKKILVMLILLMVTPVLVSAADVNNINTNGIYDLKEGELQAPTFTIKTGNGTNKIVISNFTDGINYEVYRSSKKTTGYVSIGTTNTLEFVDTNVDVGYTYYYKLRAIKGEEKIDSKVVAKKVGLIAPTVKVVSNNTTTLTVSWNAVEGANGYQVYRATSKNGKYKKVKTTTDTSFVNTKLTVGKGYYYKVRAYKKYNKVGYSSYSKVVGGIPKLPATTASGVSADYNKVKLTWNKVSKASGYTVYRLVGKKYKAIKNTKSLSYTDSKLTTGTNYTYVVRAYVLKGKKKYYGYNSNTVKVVPTLKTPNVTINNKLSRYSLTVSTKKVAGATGYYFYKLNNGNYNLLYKTTDLSIVDRNVVYGATTTYKVVAYRIVNGKEYVSNEVIKSEVVRPAQAKITPERLDYNYYQITSVIPEFEDTDIIKVRVYGKLDDSEFGLVREDTYPAEEVKKRSNYYFVHKDIILGHTYSYKIVYNINGVDSVESNIVSVTPYLDRPVAPTISNYIYGEVILTNSTAVSGADGYEFYASKTKKGKYTKIGEIGSTGVVTYKTGYNKGYYYATRAYKLVDGKRIYSKYSPVKGYKANLKMMTELPVKLPLNMDPNSYITFKGVSISKVKTTSTTVTYKIKLKASKSYMRTNTKVTGKIKYYDYLANELGYKTYTVKLARGTKKNWTKTITVTLPKNAVFLTF